MTSMAALGTSLHPLPARTRAGTPILIVAVAALVGGCATLQSPPPPGSVPATNPASSTGVPASPSGTSPTTQPTEVSASPAASLAGTPPPITWTTLTVTEIASPRPTNGAVISWSGGDLAVAPERADGPERVWRSPDGLTWTELPATTLGFDDPTGNTLLNSATRCGDGVLVETVDGAAHVSLWSSPDLVSWTQHPFHNASRGDLAAIGTTAVANVDTGGGSATGMALDVAPDCATWQRVTLPGPRTGQITGLVADAAGFVAVGYAGDVQGTASTPLAWWSKDGMHWSAAVTPATRGEGFEEVWAGNGGFLALSTDHRSFGVESLWSSPDGHRWFQLANAPLGAIRGSVGAGSPAGSVTGDGTQLLVYGRPGVSPADDSSGTAEYWISTDGTSWTRLTFSGPGATAMLADQYPVPMLTPTGVLFAGRSTTWFGAP